MSHIEITRLQGGLAIASFVSGVVIAGMRCHKGLCPERHAVRNEPLQQQMKKNEARIDKWLWAARIFKTRTIAAAACKKGQVSMKGAQLKPSRTIREGDVIDVRKPPITYSFRVLQAIEKRVGAKLIPEILENVTAPEQYEILEMAKISGFVGRAKGLGRPTKKDRRSLDSFTSEVPEFFGDFDFDFDDGTDDGEYDEDSEEEMDED